MPLSMTQSNEFYGNYIALTSISWYLKFCPFYFNFYAIVLIEVDEKSIFVMFSYPSSNISSLKPILYNLTNYVSCQHQHWVSLTIRVHIARWYLLVRNIFGTSRRVMGHECSVITSIKFFRIGSFVYLFICVCICGV